MGNFTKYYSTLLDRFPDNNARGKVFETHCAEWLEADPIWGPQIKRVVPWKNWEKTESVDIGTDLVIEFKNGETWSVQCKATKPGKSLDFSTRLTNFLSHSMGPVFQGRLLMTTTNSVSKNVEEMIRFQAKDLQAIYGHDFEDSALDFYALAFEESVLVAAPEKKQLRKYQNKAVTKIVEELGGSDRAQISMACGTGKTFTSYSAWRALEPESTLVLVPSIHLLKQTLREWIGFENNAPSFNWIAVCSDESVSNNPDVPGTKLENFSSPTTTSSSAIRKFISNRGKKVIFSTYQSSIRVRDAFDDSTVKLNLAICDEAHRLVGTIKELSPFLSMIAPRPHFLQKSLFMTATPKTINPSLKTRLEKAGQGVITMDDETVFGRRCFSFTFREAIPKYLSPYRIAITVMSKAELRESVERRRFVEVGGDTMALDEIAKQVALQKAITKYGLSRVISYHSSLRGAARFASEVESGEIISKAGMKGFTPIETAFVSGKQNSDVRAENLKILSKGSALTPKLVSNARCLTEGIDIPALDGVMFADPKYSEVDIVQAIGRALRKFPGKEIGTVVVPVFADAEEDFEEQLSKSRWSTVWKTIRALEAHDPSLNAELSGIRTELGRGKKPSRLPGEIEILGIEDLPADFATELQLKIVRESTNSWYENLGRYAVMAKKLKTGRVPQTFSRNSEKIPEGVWGAHQRTLYRLKKLDEDQIQKLEQIEGWSWEPLDDDWNFAIRRCREAGLKFKNYFKIPNKYVDETGFRLGQWLTSITSNARWGSVPVERKKELQDALPGFVTNKRERAWQLGCETALAWLGSEMEDPSEIIIPETGTKLSSWLQVNSALWLKRDEDDLDSDEKQRIKILAEIPGWKSFAVRKRKAETLAKIAKLRVKADANGFYEFHLFRCRGECQKHFKKEASCTIENLRVSQNGLGVPDNLFFKLRRYLEGLEAFSSSFGTTYHPQTKDGTSFVWDAYALGSQLNTLRSREKDSDETQAISALLKEILDAKRVFPQLNKPSKAKTDLTFVFYACPGDCKTHFNGKAECSTTEIQVFPNTLSLGSTTLQSFLAYLEAVADYSREKGRSTHPQNMNKKAFRWKGVPIGSTLNRYRSRVSEDIKNEIAPYLEQIPGWSWTSLDDDDWLQKFEILRRYVAEHGTSRVPQQTKFENFNLGNWVHRQLTAGRGNRYLPLNSWQKEALLNLPDWTFDTWGNRDVYANRRDSWEHSYSAYLKFLKQSKGECLPKADVQIDGVNLGRWLNSQMDKILGKSQSGVITDEEKQKLMDIDCFSNEIERRREKDHVSLPN